MSSCLPCAHPQFASRSDFLEAVENIALAAIGSVDFYRFQTQGTDERARGAILGFENPQAAVASDRAISRRVGAEHRNRYGRTPRYLGEFQGAESVYWKRAIPTPELGSDFFPSEFRQIQVTAAERPELEQLVRQVVEVRLTIAQRDRATAHNMAQQPNRAF